MFQLFTFLLAFSAAGSVTAAPSHFSKRIAQVISASTTKWEAACNAAGGGQKCNQIAVNAFGTLLAGAGPCDQQDSADSMMDLSKQLNSNPMINFAQIFVQQPRNAPDRLSVLYCQKAPRNTELNGLFQCQFQGVNPTVFTGNVQVGASGTVPFGQTTPLNPPGSCPAHPAGPIADGTQLVDQVSSSGAPTGNSSGSGSNNGTPSSAAPQTSSSPTPVSSSAAAAASPSQASAPIASSSSGDFHAQNAQDAQALNQMFLTLTPNSSCTGGQPACVQGQFVQCVNGQFVLTQCSAGTSCMALPLVNKRGTTVTCDSQSDANARISAALNS